LKDEWLSGALTESTSIKTNDVPLIVRLRDEGRVCRCLVEFVGTLATANGSAFVVPKEAFMDQLMAILKSRFSQTLSDGRELRFDLGGTGPPINLGDGDMP